MIIRMGLLKKARHLSQEQFAEHWRSVHGPLAARVPGLRLYSQHVVTNSDQLGISYQRGQWDFDGFSELHFDDADSMRKAISSEEYQAVAEDAMLFLESVTMISAERQVVVPVNEQAEHLIKRMSILTRPDHVTAETFRHEWFEVHDAMVRKFPNVEGYNQNLIVSREIAPNVNATWEELPIDGIVELWFRSIKDINATFASDAGKRAQAHAREFIKDITTFLVETTRVV